jgi:hypothetical protein
MTIKQFFRKFFRRKLLKKLAPNYEIVRDSKCAALQAQVLQSDANRLVLHAQHRDRWGTIGAPVKIVNLSGSQLFFQHPLIGQLRIDPGGAHVLPSPILEVVDEYPQQSGYEKMVREWDAYQVAEDLILNQVLAMGAGEMLKTKDELLNKLRERGVYLERL